MFCPKNFSFSSSTIFISADSLLSHHDFSSLWCCVRSEMYDDLAVVGIFRVSRMLYLICDLSGSMVFSPWYEPISNHDIIHKWRSWMKIISSHHPGIDDENYLTMKIFKMKLHILACKIWLMNKISNMNVDVQAEQVWKKSNVQKENPFSIF